MAANTEINLRQTPHTELTGDVDQESDLHAVGLLQRDDVECAAPSGGLTGQRLSDFTESGIEQRKNRARGELVHSTAAGRMLCRAARNTLSPIGFWRSRSGWMRRATNSEVVLMTSASRNTTNSDVVAVSPARIASPLPLGPSNRITRAPWWSATVDVSSTELSFTTTSFVDQVVVREGGVEDRTNGRRFVAGRNDDRHGGVGLQAGDAFETEIFSAKGPRDVWAAHP